MTAALLTYNEAMMAEFSRWVARHEQRRRENLPTISTLVGPVALGQQLWQSWAEQHQRTIAMSFASSKSSWFAQWVAALLDARDLHADAEQYLARRIDNCPNDFRTWLQRKTSRDVELIFESVGLSDRGLHPDRLCRWLLLNYSGDRTLSADELIRRQMAWADSASGACHDGFRQLIGLLGTAEPPLLLIGLRETLVDVPASVKSTVPVSMGQVVQNLARLVSLVPEQPVGFVIDETTWNASLQIKPARFANAILHENMKRIEELSSPNMVCDIASGDCLNDDLAKSPIVEQCGDADSHTLSPPNLTQLDCDSHTIDVTKDVDWKSEQERFLFEFIESTSDLCGLFQLNVDPGFKFGKRPAEIDLGCLDLKIAIEIDGYYHFQDQDNYRRDRRKDLALQRHDYIILRFLADDVVPKSRSILNTIRETVQLQKSKTLTMNERTDRK